MIVYGSSPSPHVCKGRVLAAGRGIEVEGSMAGPGVPAPPELAAYMDAMLARPSSAGVLARDKRFLAFR